MDIDTIERLKINTDYLSEFLLDGISHVIVMQRILIELLIDERKEKKDV